MKMDNSTTLAGAASRGALLASRTRNVPHGAHGAAERALVSKLQRLLKHSQDVVGALAALEREAARLSAELDRTQANVSAVLSELARRRPPATKRM